VKKDKAETYIVEIPIAGSMSIDVTAESEADAIEIAWKIFNNEGPEPFDVEWEVLNKITEGNVTHAPVNDVRVEKVK